MERLYNVDCDLKMLNPLTLAFIGDGVYDLLIREMLICSENYPVGKLNKMKVERVCCKAQSEFIQNLIPHLTEEEVTIFKRGRNAHTNSIPKNATNADYHNATGFEALIGYTYLKGDIQRLRELFDLILKMINL